MQIFTDASLANQFKTGKPLFSTHGLVVLDDNFEVVQKESYTSFSETVLIAEQKTILYAMRNYAEYGDTIYTDSQLTFKNPSKKIKNEIKSKNLKLEYIPRELNMIADMLCTKERNMELQKRMDKKEILLPKIKKIMYTEEQLADHFKSMAKNSMFNDVLVEEKQFYTFDLNSASELAKELDIQVKVKKPKLVGLYDTQNIFESLTDTELEEVYKFYYTKMVNTKLDLKDFKVQFKKCNWVLEKTKACIEYAVMTFTLATHKRKELSRNSNYFNVYSI